MLIINDLVLNYAKIMLLYAVLAAASTLCSLLNEMLVETNVVNTLKVDLQLKPPLYEFSTLRDGNEWTGKGRDSKTGESSAFIAKLARNNEIAFPLLVIVDGGEQMRRMRRAPSQLTCPIRSLFLSPSLIL